MEALGLDLISFAWQVVAFCGLIFLLNLLLFRPIRRTLDERVRRIQESMEEADRVKQQAARADEEYAMRVEAAQRQAQVIEDEGREQARQEREDILEQAHAEAKRLLEDARTQIDLERRDAARETRRQVASLAILAAGRLIGETLDERKHQRLVEEYLTALEEPLEELERSLAAIPAEEVRAVQIRSAAPLDEGTQEALRARVLRALGREVQVVFSVDPSLIGGFVLQVGDQIVDLSVSQKLSDLFREMAA